MEKRALIAVGLALVVLFAWSALFPPPKRPAVPTPETTSQQGASGPETPGGGAESKPVDTAGSAAGTQAESTPSESTPGSAPTDRIEATAESKVTIDTGLARVVLSNRGGRVESWTLAQFKDDTGHPYELVSPAATLAKDPPAWPLGVSTGQDDVDQALERALFQVDQSTGPEGGPIVTFHWSDGAGLEARKILEFIPNSYLVHVTAEVLHDGKVLPATVNWGPGLGKALQKQRKSNFDHIGRGIFGSSQSVERRDVRAVPARQEVSAADGTAPVGGIEWAGLEEQYFAAVFLADGAGAFPKASIAPREILPAPGEKLEKHLVVSVPVPADHSITLYAGPKDHELLKTIGHGTPQLIHFSQPVFGLSFLSPLIGLLAEGLYLVLRWLHGMIPNWGVAIILLTTVIRLAFYPLTQKAFVKMRRSQQEMQAVAPKVNAIKTKYAKQKGAEARNKMNQEVMDLYRKEGINPFAAMTGCLPMLIQLPLLYGMYNVLTVSVELRKAPFFGWIQDLSTYDPWYVTPILMGVTMFIQQKMAMTKVLDPQQRAQQRMMMFMPFMFTWMFLWLPSGLTLYWFVSNLLQIGQQILINRQAERILGPVGGGNDTPGKGRKSKKAENGGSSTNPALPAGASAMARGDRPAGNPQSS